MWRGRSRGSSEVDEYRDAALSRCTDAPPVKAAPILMPRQRAPGDLRVPIAAGSVIAPPEEAAVQAKS